MQTVQYLVTVRLPDNISKVTMERYIRNAVKLWKGQMDPAGDICNLPFTAITVKRYVPEKILRPSQY